MNRRTGFFLFLILFILAGQGHRGLSGAACCAGPDSTEPYRTATGVLTVKQILDEMHKAAQTLISLQADVDYLFIQDPELLEARSVRQGTLYYSKGTPRSNLRISFHTVQQDEEEPQSRPEHYLFDGVWLTKIDWAMETVDLYQKAPADQPVGVFDFISHNFPMVGFTDPQKLEKEFYISVSPVPAEPNELQHLFLKVREDSIYKDDYTKIEVWVNRRTWLPVRLTAVSVQGDFLDLKWHDLRTNEPIQPEVFRIEIPAHFRKNTHPLEK